MASTRGSVSVATGRKNGSVSSKIKLDRSVPLPPQPNPGGEDPEEVLLEAIADDLKNAYLNENRALLDDAETYLSRLLVLRKLWKAFRASPGHKIDGSGGVKEQLQVSRNGVYCLLQMVRYDPVDFVDCEDFWSLVRRSQGLKRLADRLPAVREALRSIGAKKKK
jgi:hypothetical protein